MADISKIKTPNGTTYDIVDRGARGLIDAVGAAAIIIDTASGAPVSVPDGADDLPMQSVKVMIEPKQAGSGTPSPDNVRPISGWDEVTVTRQGNDLFNLGEFATLYPGYCSYSNGTLTVNSINAGVLWSTGVPCYLPSGTVFNCAITEDTAVNVRVRFAFANGGITERKNGQFPYTLTEDVVAIRLDWSTAGKFSVSNFQTKLVETYTTPLPTTVYGGTLNVVRGELVVDRAMVDLGTLNWAYSAGSSNIAPYFYVNFSGIKSPGPPYTFPINAVCSQYPVVIRSFATAKDKTLFGDGTTTSISQIQIKDSAYTDASAFKSAMSGVQLCYELATPITYHLAPQEVRTLLGTNDFMSEAGSVEIMYPCDTKRFIQKKTVAIQNDLDELFGPNSNRYFEVDEDGNLYYCVDD